jgi:hypothetical protein
MDVEAQLQEDMQELDVKILHFQLVAIRELVSEVLRLQRRGGKYTDGNLLANAIRAQAWAETQYRKFNSEGEG